MGYHLFDCEDWDLYFWIWFSFWQVFQFNRMSITDFKLPSSKYSFLVFFERMVMMVVPLMMFSLMLVILMIIILILLFISLNLVLIFNLYIVKHNMLAQLLRMYIFLQVISWLYEILILVLLSLIIHVMEIIVISRNFLVLQVFQIEIVIA